jgi:hypothetical protein
MTAFSPLANATLVFQVPTGDLTAPLGQTTSAVTPLVVVAYLRSDRGYRIQPSADGLVQGQAMTGRAIAPSVIPAAIQAEQRAECVFWRSGLGLLTLPPSGFADVAAYEDFLAAHAESVAIVGEFYWEANIPGSLGVEVVLGDKLRGRFVARSSWVDGV